MERARSALVIVKTRQKSSSTLRNDPRVNREKGVRVGDKTEARKNEEKRVHTSKRSMKI